MKALQRSQEMRLDVEEFNAEVRQELSTMSLSEAKEICRLVKQTEEWLVGIRKLLS